MVTCAVFPLAIGSAKTDPVAIDSVSRFYDFIRADGTLQHVEQPTTKQMSLPIPSVFIFSPKGKLVFLGNIKDMKNTTALLEGMPMSVAQLTPIADSPKLASMLEIVPEFKAQEKNILENGHYVVYLVTMKRPQPTPTQKLVLALRARVQHLPIDTHILYLQE
jgi:hypothetical protein